MQPKPIDTPQTQQAFVNWFRNSSPYIHAHRKRTFVISFEGEALLSTDFAHHVHDFALLNSLGIRLVLVHGIRPQIDERLQQLNLEPRFHQNLRVTDAQALECVKEAAGLVRVEIEARLSLGLANSPMAGAKIRVISGNFVTAKPLGVIDGVDYLHTGVVRGIDSDAIHQQLSQHNVVLISPIGYSPSGEVFNLSAEQVATEVAIALHAEKLILLTEQDCCDPLHNRSVAQMTTQEAISFLAQHTTLAHAIRRPLLAAITGCKAGIERVHLINRHHDGALLLELFSRDGIGTLISSDPFESIRPATLKDIAGILELITPLEQQGILVKRDREKLEMEITDYIIIERDGMIIACTALHVLPNAAAGVIACMAVHPNYQKGARGNRLLEYVTKRAKTQQLMTVFVLTTQTEHWFLERGFITADFAKAPATLKSRYNPQRNSKILVKTIG
ncbi:MAG: amino-acid N-acetyltransferase [Methylococcaceae bacterium]|nr:amino-acid N-acetyltransferase [Methylococcaceae bacterium]